MREVLKITPTGWHALLDLLDEYEATGLVAGLPVPFEFNADELRAKALAAIEAGE